MVLRKAEGLRAGMPHLQMAEATYYSVFSDARNMIWSALRRKKNTLADQFACSAGHPSRNRWSFFADKRRETLWDLTTQ